ncbi:leucine-rich repeat domain-containing protein [Pseudomonas moraviensis subsp. stanleyae]|uniref:leucine-rich repeat domain-containing protein n=1 Tax=Pseudomonas moraviensis TaxID=321662 RepID=UPI002E3454C5|nr:hypothetical protein [Pseudomonas moraviensis]MED7665905.1 leucine-rich repeat domain-containing protein [Pseudomonas moraviensis subsp. stanleyae]
MPVKPPRGSTRMDTDVHTATTRHLDKDFPQVRIADLDGIALRVRGDDPKLRSTLPGDDIGADMTLPAPMVEVRSAPHTAQNPVVIHSSLESYAMQSPAGLPEADSDGFRLYKNRQYVDVTDGGIVLVGVDPDSGFHRARRTSELLPSGPWMLRDIPSGLWHPHNDFNARTDPLTDASLQAFRSGLDLSGVEPGSDGVFRHDGRLYVVIDEQAYQVLQDLDASRPEYKIWRLVDPRVPVASDSANIYRASLGGETLAITRNEQNDWVSILPGLRGGMERNDPAHANPFNFHRPWLIGAGPSARQAPVVVATTRAQVKRYFADATDQHADDFIALFADAGAAEVELRRLQLEYPQLNREVTAWETAYRGDNSAERGRRLAVGASVRRLFKWQGESSEKVYRNGLLIGFKLKLNLGERGNFALPAFSTRLRSVVSLGLEGRTSKNLGDLFSMFPRMDTLETRRINGHNLLVELDKLPQLRVLEIRESSLLLSSIGLEHFAKLTGLQELSLLNCGIWPDLSVRGMTGLRVLRARSCALLRLPLGLDDLPVASQLQVLDLYHNPELRNPPDVSLMSQLRVLDLSHTRIPAPPLGLGLQSGPSRLQVLNLSNTPLAVAPSLRGMPALLEVDLSHTCVTTFPAGVTFETPKTRLDLSYTWINSIPEAVELRKGFNLSGTLISDPASFRRLIAARRQTGTDVWLARASNHLVIDHWMHNVPQAQRAARTSLWDSLTDQTNIAMMAKIRELVRTPEFQVERALLQRRVWSFLEHFHKSSLGEQDALRDIALTEPSPGRMLERLEEEIKNFDSSWQHQPSHHLPKRPRLA